MLDTPLLLFTAVQQHNHIYAMPNIVYEVIDRQLATSI